VVPRPDANAAVPETGALLLGRRDRTASFSPVVVRGAPPTGLVLHDLDRSHLRAVAVGVTAVVLTLPESKRRSVALLVLLLFATSG
jgi:hypothetical protein